MKVNLNSVNDIKDFVNIASKFDDGISVVSGNSIINAKSIVGMCSLDLSSPIEVTTEGKNSESIYNAFSKYSP